MITETQKAALVKVALDYGWVLHPHGADTACLCADPDTLPPIWMKPNPGVPGDLVPVGCLCCTDLSIELLSWNEDRKAARWSEVVRSWAYPPVREVSTETLGAGNPLGKPVSELPIYIPR